MYGFCFRPVFVLVMIRLISFAFVSVPFSKGRIEGCAFLWFQPTIL